jgi:hypothetical protein
VVRREGEEVVFYISVLLSILTIGIETKYKEIFAKILAVFAFCICKVLLKEQLVSIAMPIDCWKTCSSTYATVNSSSKSLGKIVKFISPKLTDYYIQMGRSICQYNLLAFWRKTTDPLTSLSRL